MPLNERLDGASINASQRSQLTHAAAEIGFQHGTSVCHLTAQGLLTSANSYVHTGLHPILQYHLGYLLEYAIQTVRNSNGRSTMAAMIIALLSGNSHLPSAVRKVQLDHLDCLPPLTNQSG
jgi:hypothetical protein